jgi:hypothetical protein
MIVKSKLTDFFWNLVLFIETEECQQSYQQNYCATLRHNRLSVLKLPSVPLKCKPLLLAADRNTLSVAERRERDQWRDLDVDGWIILGWVSKRRGCGHVEWIRLAQDRDRWRTLVGAVMNLRVP